jgi:glycerophosphoryl diester phosphodiesterase
MKYVVVIAFLTVACGPAQKLKRPSLPSFDQEGHRGARGLAPENTIAAMYRGIDEGVTTLELDLHISRDKQVVVSHDPYFNELITTTPEGTYLTKQESRKRLLYQMNYDSISKYDVGLKLHPDFPRQQKMPAVKPLFTMLIDSAEAYSAKKGKQIWYNAEIKSKEEGDGVNHPAVPEFVELVVQTVRTKGIASRIIIQSFDARPLRYLHDHYPAMQTSYLLEAKDKGTVQDYVQNLGFKPSVLSPHYSLVTTELLKEAHALGIRVIPWTVNTLADIRRLRDMGVDGIITDYPDLFHQ